jgi:multimeric flavodoxin WrbA
MNANPEQPVNNLKAKVPFTKPGVQTDMRDGDEWSRIREQILASDILVIATPIWLGHPASLAQKVLERLDAELSETDGQGRPSMYDKVALVAVDFSIPAQGSTNWVGEPCTAPTSRTCRKRRR